MIQVTIVIKNAKQTFEIKGSLKHSTFESKLWDELRRGVDQLSEVFPRDVIGALTREEEMHLKLGSALLPKVWAQDGRLLYDHEVPKDVLSFQGYKSILKSMQVNLDELFKRAKERKATASESDPLSRKARRLPFSV